MYRFTLLVLRTHSKRLGPRFAVRQVRDSRGGGAVPPADGAAVHRRNRQEDEVEAVRQEAAADGVLPVADAEVTFLILIFMGQFLGNTYLEDILVYENLKYASY